MSVKVHPLYMLKDTRLQEPHAGWRGREVIDRHGRAIGRVRDIMVEERTMEEAAEEDHDPRAWTVRADYALVTVDGLLPQFTGHMVMLPIGSLIEEDELLRADQEVEEIRVNLES